MDSRNAALTLALTCALVGCHPRAKTAPVAIEREGGEGGSSVVQPAPGSDRAAPKDASIEGSLREFGDVIDAVEAISRRWTDEPVEVRPALANAALATGLPHDTFERLDARGVLAGFGQPSGTTARPSADAGFVISVPTANPQRLLEALPPSLRPQPLGGARWQWSLDTMVLFGAERGGAFDVATDLVLLDRAPPLVERGKTGPRAQIRAQGLPLGTFLETIDAEEIGRGTPLARYYEVLATSERWQMEGELGTDRDFWWRMTAEADFGRLGLDFLGPPLRGDASTAGPSDRLPPEHAFAAELSLGTTRSVHANLDRALGGGEVPAPFDKPFAQAISGVHSLLDQFSGRVTVAAYADAKGLVYFVAIAEVKDSAAALAATRQIVGGVHAMMRSHIALLGDDKDSAYTATLSTGTVALGKVKGDELLVTVPREIRDSSPAIIALAGGDKPRVALVDFVDGNHLVVVLARDARAVATQIAKNNGGSRSPASSLLSFVRVASAGCQFCGVADLKRGVLFLTAVDGKRRVASYDAAMVKRLSKLSLNASVGVGVRIEGGQSSATVAMPQASLFADPVHTRAFRDAITASDRFEPDPRDRIRNKRDR